MRKIRLDEQIKILGVKNFKEDERLVDYYLVTHREKIYAFSKIYTNNSYEICKSGIRVNELVAIKTRDSGIMRLVKYTNFMLPYLTAYYNLPLAQ